MCSSCCVASVVLFGVSNLELISKHILIKPVTMLFMLPNHYLVKQAGTCMFNVNLESWHPEFGVDGKYSFFYVLYVQRFNQRYY